MNDVPKFPVDHMTNTCHDELSNRYLFWLGLELAGARSCLE